MMPVLVNLWNPNLMTVRIFCRALNRAAALSVLATLPFITACGSNIGFPGVYRINVEQGNVVTEEMVDQLEVGMTRRQVRFVMGTPLIEDTFNADQWDYRYYLRNGDDTIKESRLTVRFEGDELIAIEGTDLPLWAGSSGSDGARKKPSSASNADEYTADEDAADSE